MTVDERIKEYLDGNLVADDPYFETNENLIRDIKAYTKWGELFDEDVLEAAIQRWRLAEFKRRRSKP